MPTTTDVLAQVADIIAPHLTGDFKRRERADNIAHYHLHAAGLLAGGTALLRTGTVREQTAAALQCVFNWPVAEQITAELAAAGLLRQES